MALIDRDALCKKCVQKYGKCNSINRGRCGVAKAKTVDARPVVHGEWRDECIREPSFDGLSIKLTHYDRCSVCCRMYRASSHMNFCPNCGADMRGDGDGVKKEDDGWQH